MLPNNLKVNTCYSIDASKIMHQLPAIKFLAIYEGTTGGSDQFYSFRQEGDVIFPFFSLTGIEVFYVVSYVNMDEFIS
jgi:hypothetical protein